MRTETLSPDASDDDHVDQRDGSSFRKCSQDHVERMPLGRHIKRLNTGLNAFQLNKRNKTHIDTRSLTVVNVCSTNISTAVKETSE